MQLRLTYIVIVLNVFAFGLILLLDNRKQSYDSKISGLAECIGAAVIETDRIELRGQIPDKSRIIERQGSKWMLTKPLQWKANTFAVNRILNQLQFIQEEASFYTSEIERSGQSLADFGLAKPKFKLIIGKGEKKLVLSIGDTTEIGGNVYLLGPHNAKIYVVSREVIDSLLVELGDLQSRSIFSIPVFEIDALKLQIRTYSADSDLKVRLARTSSGWLFEAPLNAQADPVLVANTINSLTAVKVIRFQQGDDFNMTGLNDPTMEVTLHGNRRQQTLFIGKKDPSSLSTEGAYFAMLKGNPTIFTLPAKPFDALREAQAALRERNFMSFDPSTINAVQIGQGAQEIRLQKLEKGAWQVIRSGEGADIQPHRTDPALVKNVLENLLELRAISFAADAPTTADLNALGFSNPQRTIKLVSPNETIMLELASPESENNKLYARTSESIYIYEIDRRTTLELLPLDALMYRNRLLDSLPQAARIQKIRLENIQTGELLFEKSLSAEITSWDSLLDSTADNERVAIFTLLAQLRDFSVKKYLLSEFTSNYSLDSQNSAPWMYRLSAEVLLPGDSINQLDTRSYVFSKRLAGAVQIGGSEDHATVFEANQSIIDAIYTFTHNTLIPPEATGRYVPTPEPVDTLPTPESILKSPDL
ncbi:MAG: DUF4340 domain-containing protein [Verrucomicrobiota bacterium]|nr:DUF4340 domain-containing protein [Verrucomicrobiota bacterium]